MAGNYIFIFKITTVCFCFTCIKIFTITGIIISQTLLVVHLWLCLFHFILQSQCFVLGLFIFWLTTYLNAYRSCAIFKFMMTRYFFYLFHTVLYMNHIKSTHSSLLLQHRYFDEICDIKFVFCVLLVLMLKFSMQELLDIHLVALNYHQVDGCFSRNCALTNNYLKKYM